MELENPYFDVQAELGITKHAGGLRATEALIESCRLGRETRVLDVGCGVGTTTCHIARKLGCPTVGVDISPRMIERATERIRRKGLADRVELRVADAQDLPFEDGAFDAVLSESVTAFAADKQAAVREYARVVRPGGYVGLSETTWLTTETPRRVIDFVDRSIGGVRPLTSEGWQSLLATAGLREIAGSARKITLLAQIGQEIRGLDPLDAARAWSRLLTLVATRSVYRRAIRGMVRDALSIPRGLFGHFGFGIYTGRK